MIRVIYKWRVKEANIPHFMASWDKTTSAIRETVVGARGSLLLQSRERQDMFTTIARWDTYDNWQAFWGDETQSAMNEMHRVAERLSVEVYEEHGDHTV